ncbi:hypothetical protein NDU88_006294 [Pleurodeles waltl]|uniref:Uncharacterized protein n=1 Tax=Pleurodeles waltl TaxID=8319 RepID=A0AAV7N0U9_PLEWA|nr:hypothetical protein NDU88_006294 [Pleurodeles waltl]
MHGNDQVMIRREIKGRQRDNLFDGTRVGHSLTYPLYPHEQDRLPKLIVARFTHSPCPPVYKVGPGTGSLAQRNTLRSHAVAPSPCRHCDTPEFCRTLLYGRRCPLANQQVNTPANCCFQKLLRCLSLWHRQRSPQLCGSTGRPPLSRCHEAHTTEKSLLWDAA